jgi:hypothetical protein
VSSSDLELHTRREKAEYEYSAFRGRILVEYS